MWSPIAAEAIAQQPAAVPWTRASPMQPHQAEQFAALWAASQSTVSAFIRTLVPDYQQADEVVQRVAVTLVRKYDQYDQSRSFAAWAIGVAKFEVLYYRRERATDRHQFGDDIVEQIASRYEALAEESTRSAMRLRIAWIKWRAVRGKSLNCATSGGFRRPRLPPKCSFRPAPSACCSVGSAIRLRRCIERRISHDNFRHVKFQDSTC